MLLVACANTLFAPRMKEAISSKGCLQAQGAQPLAEMPAWTLPDDNSGLDALLRSQVRILPASLHENIT
jgi:hypothetical protein